MTPGRHPILFDIHNWSSWVFKKHKIHDKKLSVTLSIPSIANKVVLLNLNLKTNENSA